MFPSSDSSKERGMESTTHTPPSDGSFALAPGNSGQGLFTSLLKGEPPIKTCGASAFVTPQDTGTKEKTSIFGKPSFFSFSKEASSLTPEVTPFQVKNISIGLSTPPSTTVGPVPSSQSSSLAKPQVPLKNITGLAPDSKACPFTSSSVFTLPKDNAGSSLLPPKIPVTKPETSFSFAETFRKEKTMDKSLPVEPQPEQQNAGIFRKPPAFSFSSAAANIMSDNKVSGQSSISMVFRGPASNLPPVSNVKDREQYGSRGAQKAGSETLTRKLSSKASPIPATSKISPVAATNKISPMAATNKTASIAATNKTSPIAATNKTSPIAATNKTSPRLTSKASIQVTIGKTSPRMTISKASPETTSIKSPDETARKASLGNSGGSAITLHMDSPGSSSASHHTVKDHGSSLVKKFKHRKELITTKIRKKSKDDGSKADNKSSGLLTPEEITKLTSIVCKGIHPDINHRSDIIKHFSKFGQIKRVSCSSRHNHAVITFFTHEAAKKAKKLGSVISPSYNPVEMFWHTHSSKSSDEKKPLFQSEVHEELESMMELETHDILNRPAEHQPSKSPKTSPSRKPNEKAKSDLKDSKHSEKVKPSKSGDFSEDSLKKLLEMQALTEEDKYDVLHARDKLMRMSLQKQSDISKAKAVAGTCPDICSEKERYSRFQKKCLSLYEQKKTFDPSITIKCLDHRIIVKEYSRSSADKEEPLPHEIRPAHVLSLAMDHLMCNIANRVTDSSLSVGEWYDFIWNRTRAIRKDITQQDLCSIECVKLVEKCVRFHIHCAATLCEEDMAVFDPKINDENLTKSLQTLKHMYHDLALIGTKCPNEAEFRAYDILLSLNEGDTLRQAQNFSSKIRGSPEVRFAVSAAFAVNSNNYCRFFKLLEEASYLNACIMHRYFTPVRVKALRVMLKAYCLPNHVELYPLEELVKILKFDSAAEASQFCQWLGFRTDESHVQLDRMSFVTPSSSTFVTRSINVVEKKRNVSVGEVMNKGPLPVNPLVSYEPHCSFDCDGYLKKEAYDCSDQKLKAEQGNETVTITVIQSEPVHEGKKEKEVVPPNEPEVMVCETSADSSPKCESPIVQHLASDAGQRHTVKTVEIKRPSDSKTLPIRSTPLLKTNEEQNKICNKEQVFQSFRPSDRKTLPVSTPLITTNEEKNKICTKEQALKSVRPPDYKTLPRSTPLITASEEKNKICEKEQVFQSFQNVAKAKKVHPSASLSTVEVFKYMSDIWHHLSSEVIENYAHAVATHEYETEITCINLGDSLSDEVVKDLCFEVSCDVIRDVVKEEMAACEIEKQNEEKNKIEKQNEECANSMTEEMILETVEEQILNFVENEYQEARAQILDAACRSLMKSIVENYVSELTTILATEVHSQEKNSWQNLIQAAKRKTQLQQARKAIARWRRAYMKRRKLEICRDTFPCSPQIPMKANSALSDHESVLSKVKKKEKLSKLLDAGVLFSSIKQEFSWLPLDLAGLFEKHLLRLEAADSANPKKICWKLLLLIPENCGGGDDDDASWTSFIHWFCAKFCREKLEKSFEDGMILCDLFEKKCHGYHANICVRAVFLGSKDFLQNLEVMKKKRLLDGTSAAFLLIPSYNMNNSVHKEILNQVQQIFHTKRPFPPVPLYCFLAGSEVFQIPPTVTQVLDSLKKKLFLCDYKVASVDDALQYWKSSEELLKATSWLLEQYKEVPALISCSLKDFVEDCFLKIFNIIYEDLSHITSPTKAQNPLKMIVFYNSVIHDYTEAVCSPILSKISWPPPEVIRYDHVSEVAVGWNELENLIKIRSTLDSMHLPEFHGSSVSLDDLWTYARQVANVGGTNSCNFFASIKSFLLHNEQFLANNSFIPWSDIVYDCAHYVISCQSFIDESVKKELQVAYVAEDLNCIDLKLKWQSIPLENEVVINDQNACVKKRKHYAERVHESLQPGDAYLSDILEHSPVKYPRNEDEEQGITSEQHSTEGRVQPSPTSYQQRGYLSASNMAMCNAERKSFALTDALAAEKCQSESFLSLLEAKVAEGQFINEGMLDDTFAEDYDDGIDASTLQSYSRKSDYSLEEDFSVLFTSVNLNNSLEELKDRLATQQKANESYERQFKEFT